MRKVKIEGRLMMRFFQERILNKKGSLNNNNKNNGSCSE